MPPLNNLLVLGIDVVGQSRLGVAIPKRQRYILTDQPGTNPPGSFMPICPCDALCARVWPCECPYTRRVQNGLQGLTAAFVWLLAVLYVVLSHYRNTRYCVHSTITQGATYHRRGIYERRITPGYPRV